MDIQQAIPIINFPEYLVYPNGTIYSLKSNKFLKPQHSGNTPYMKVTLRNETEIKQKLVHRLVAEAFLDNPNNLPEVDHIDCNPSNNNVENLKWISREDNLNRSFELKHQTFNKKKVIQYDLNNNKIAEYESVGEAFKKTNIRHISEVANGHRKTAGGFIWKFKEKEGD